VLILVLFGTRDLRNEGFDNTGALINLASTRSDPFVPMNEFSQLEYSTSVNDISRKIDKKIYNDLTEQGIRNLTESGYSSCA
jgi:hypothetical protein